MKDLPLVQLIGRGKRNLPTEPEVLIHPVKVNTDFIGVDLAKGKDSTVKQNILVHGDGLTNCRICSSDPVEELYTREVVSDIKPTQEMNDKFNEIYNHMVEHRKQVSKNITAITGGIDDTDIFVRGAFSKSLAELKQLTRLL